MRDAETIENRKRDSKRGNESRLGDSWSLVFLWQL